MESRVITTPVARPRRLRKTSAIRDLVAETRLHVDDFIFPLFIKAGLNGKQAIASMPGCFQFGLDALEDEVNIISQLGIKAVLLFGIPLQKDAMGTDAYSDANVIAEAVRCIKKIAPALIVITDLCCCEYTDHGHCGSLDHNNDVDNDHTLALLIKQALVHVKAGADVIAPSGMMDGCVGALRSALDHAGFQNTAILGYSVKYASSFYGPFREAAEGAPKFGSRKSYQMNPANTNEALLETKLDIEEGADMIMVKPAMPYLDIIFQVKQRYPEIPLAAYQVSGEFAMIKALAQKNGIDEKAAMWESLTAIKRAGADMIISYFAKEVAEFFRKKHANQNNLHV